MWNYNQAGATPQNPYLQQWQIQDGTKNTFRDSVSIKADWKATDTQVISLSVQDNYYKAFFANRNLNFNMGTNPAPPNPPIPRPAVPERIDARYRGSR